MLQCVTWHPWTYRFGIVKKQHFCFYWTSSLSNLLLLPLAMAWWRVSTSFHCLTVLRGFPSACPLPSYLISPLNWAVEAWKPRASWSGQSGRRGNPDHLVNRGWFVHFFSAKITPSYNFVYSIINEGERRPLQRLFSRVTLTDCINYMNLFPRQGLILDNSSTSLPQTVGRDTQEFCVENIPV